MAVSPPVKLNAIIKNVKNIGADAPTAASAFSPIKRPTINISAN